MTDGRQWTDVRAMQAKLKSCRDDKKVAQGKGGTSAALGFGRKLIPCPFSGLARRPAGAPNQKKGRLRTRWPLPRAAASAALPWATILLPLRGAGANPASSGDGPIRVLFVVGRPHPSAPEPFGTTHRI
jgi:hypothetical protein